MQGLGWKVDFAGAELLETSLISDAPDPNIGKLRQPRLVSKVSPGERQEFGVEARTRARARWRNEELISSGISVGEQVTRELSERVYKHASKGELTVTLGGDHSLVSPPAVPATSGPSG